MEDDLVLEVTVRSIHSGSSLFAGTPPGEGALVLCMLGGKVCVESVCMVQVRARTRFYAK